MKLTIDNNDSRGPQDYTPYLDATALPKISRKLNRAWQMTATLAAADQNFVVPASGGRLVLQRKDGYKLFTGYLTAAPQQQPLGYGQKARAWRYLLAGARRFLVAGAKYAGHSSSVCLAQAQEMRCAR